MVVNILGGQGVGKTTLTAQIFVVLKKLGENVEYVSKHAKELMCAKEVEGAFRSIPRKP